MEEIMDKLDVERIDKVGDVNKFRGIRKARTYREFINYKIIHFKKFSSVQYCGKEIEMMLVGLREVYEKFYPIETVDIKRRDVKTRVGEITDKGDYVELIRYRRKEGGGEPEPAIYNILKEDIVFMKKALKKFSKKEDIKTERIAEKYCKEKGLSFNRYEHPLFIGDKFNWSNFFRDRSAHVYYTDILTIMDRCGLIIYRKGAVEILDLEKELEFKSGFI